MVLHFFIGRHISLALTSSQQWCHYHFCYHFTLKLAMSFLCLCHEDGTLNILKALLGSCLVVLTWNPSRSRFRKCKWRGAWRNFLFLSLNISIGGLSTGQLAKYSSFSHALLPHRHSSRDLGGGCSEKAPVQGWQIKPLPALPPAPSWLLSADGVFFAGSCSSVA